jgi:hypothetical protein
MKYLSMLSMRSYRRNTCGLVKANENKRENVAGNGENICQYMKTISNGVNIMASAGVMAYDSHHLRIGGWLNGFNVNGGAVNVGNDIENGESS